MQKKKAFGRHIRPNNVDNNKPNNIVRKKKGNKKFNKIEKKLNRYYNCEPEQIESASSEVMIDAETNLSQWNLMMRSYE